MSLSHGCVCVLLCALLYYCSSPLCPRPDELREDSRDTGRNSADTPHGLLGRPIFLDLSPRLYPLPPRREETRVDAILILYCAHYREMFFESTSTFSPTWLQSQWTQRPSSSESKQATVSMPPTIPWPVGSAYSTISHIHIKAPSRVSGG